MKYLVLKMYFIEGLKVVNIAEKLQINHGKVSHIIR